MMFGGQPFGSVPFGGIPAPSVFVCGVANITVDFQFRIYTAAREFITNDDDTPAAQPYRGTLDQPISFKRSILGGDTIGQFTSGSGEMEIVNTDGSYDYLIQQYAIDGREIELRLGRISDNFSTWHTVFRGTASDWSVEEDVVRIELQDYGYKLSVPLQPNVYGGTGGADGTADMAGKRKPLAFGYVFNVEPPLLVPNRLIYQAHDGQIEDIVAVYDRGVPLTKAADYATYALLNAATVASGTYATCFAEGLFRLNASPAGTVTCDVKGDKTGGIYVNAASTIVRRIINRATVLNDPTDLYEPSFTRIGATQSAEIGFWSGVDDVIMVAAALAQIMGSVGGWAGFRRNGKLEVNIFEAPALQPVLYLDVTDAIEVKRDKLPAALTPPPWRHRVGYQKNYTVQSDLAGSVSDTRRAFAAEEYRLAEASNTTILIDHPFAHDLPPVNGLFVNQVDANTEAERLLDLHRDTRAIYRITMPAVPGRAYLINLGETINVTYPRWDLSVGRNLRVVEFNEDGKNNRIELAAYG